MDLRQKGEGLTIRGQSKGVGGNIVWKQTHLFLGKEESGA